MSWATEDISTLKAYLLRPAGDIGTRGVFATVVGLLLVSALSVVFASEAMPGPYSWRTHYISESAAQGTPKAWIGRLSFLCFGAAVLVLAASSWRLWNRLALWMHLAFACFMFGTAAFSHQPWLPGLPADAVEDRLHSVAASGMGVAFAVGVLARMLQRQRKEPLRRAADAVALMAAIVLSPLGAALPEIGGILQRVMFCAAYLWYGLEASCAESDSTVQKNANCIIANGASTAATIR